MPAWASSCLVNDADAKRLASPGALTPLSIGQVSVRPCRGRVSGADMTVMFSRGNGVTQLTVVRDGQELRNEIQEPLADIGAPGGIAGSLWTALTGVRPMRPGSKKFDAAEGIVLGGQLLAGQDLRLPLERFGWHPTAPVLIQAAGRAAAPLRVEGGWLYLPVKALGSGKFQLTQGGLSTTLEVVPEADFDGLAEGLKDIRSAATSDGMRALREAFLFWEQGLRMNAVAVDATR